MKRQAGSPAESEKQKGQRTDSPEMSQSYRGALKSARPRPPAPLPGVAVPEEGHTAKTEGAVRNNFLVDILKLNGEDFKGTIRHLDAIKLIFVGALGFPPQEFAGAVPGYRGNPTVLFKTKTCFNIDERFATLVNFSFIKRIPGREGETVNTFDCSIRGVRIEDPEDGENGPRYRRTAYTWVKVEGADYQLEPHIIKKWLLEYGTIMSDLTEDKVDLELSSDEEELYQGVELTTGTYSVKMLLFDQIPQFLPIGGKKIRIYYRGIQKQCTKCFRRGHLRQACENGEGWLNYVDNFMIRSKFDETYYGRWSDRIDLWRIGNEQAHKQNVENFEAEERERTERRAQQQQLAGEIIGELETQNQQQEDKYETPEGSENERPDEPENERPEESENERPEESGKENRGERNKNTQKNRVTAKKAETQEAMEVGTEVEEGIRQLSVDKSGKPTFAGAGRTKGKQKTETGKASTNEKTGRTRSTSLPRK